MRFDPDETAELLSGVVNPSNLVNSNTTRFRRWMLPGRDPFPLYDLVWLQISIGGRSVIDAGRVQTMR